MPTLTRPSSCSGAPSALLRKAEMKFKELDASQVHFSYDEKKISALRAVSSRNGIIGQPRALSALRMGMSVSTKGYNIFIIGEDGTGRHSAVRQIASQLKAQKTDLVSLYNFLNPDAPLLVLMPSPEGSRFCSLMHEVSASVQNGNLDAASKLLEGCECKDVKAFVQRAKLELTKSGINAQMFDAKLIHDGSDLITPPVVCAPDPTEAGIFGSLSGKTGFAHLDFTPGSVFSALGGFFIADMNQLLSRKGLWESIKLFAEASVFTVSSESDSNKRSVRPVVPHLPVKLILTGSDLIYDKLCETDEQFLRLFKVCAEFDFSMPASDENIAGTIAYILETAKKNGLKEVTDSGLCELLRCSSWYAEMQDELTTKLSFIGDLLHEANFFATDRIDSEAVKKALQERSFANGITEERISREIETGEMIISLEGSKTGVVNGLAVMDRGLCSFGTPAVISVSVAPGSEGIVNIEHEAGLSGEIHDKGLLILEGYLRKHYAHSFPLSIYAGICFEQSYAEVDGDSASSSELFALLSAIGELPVRQDIACTGSVNQLGDIQPVGGINEKITGFFEICCRMGLTGRQGVIIPRQNIKSLVLPDNVVKAVEERKFHIYPISTIDEGMEILTLRESGERNSKGQFPVDSANRIIEDRLKRLCGLSQRDK